MNRSWRFELNFGGDKATYVMHRFILAKEIKCWNVCCDGCDTRTTIDVHSIKDFLPPLFTIREYGDGLFLKIDQCSQALCQISHCGIASHDVEGNGYGWSWERNTHHKIPSHNSEWRRRDGGMDQITIMWSHPMIWNDGAGTGWGTKSISWDDIPSCGTTAQGWDDFFLAVANPFWVCLPQAEPSKK